MNVKIDMPQDEITVFCNRLAGNGIGFVRFRAAGRFRPRKRRDVSVHFDAATSRSLKSVSTNIS